MKIVFRWIGYVLLPIPVACIVQGLINAFILFMLGIVMHWAGAKFSVFVAAAFSCPICGALVPMLSGLLAPKGKMVSMVIMTTVFSMLLLLSILLGIGARNFPSIIGNIISLISAIIVTCVAYGKLSHQDSNNSAHWSEDESNESSGVTAKEAAIGFIGVLLGIGYMLLKIIWWFIALALCAALAHWGWGLIGQGIGWTILGALVCLATIPGLIQSVLNVLFVCLALPALCVSIFDT